MTVVPLIIGNIESGALENYWHWRENTSRLALAFGTNGRAFIIKTPLLLEPAGTTGTLIFVSGQTCLPPNGQLYKKISTLLLRLLIYSTLRKKWSSRFFSGVSRICQQIKELNDSPISVALLDDG